MTQLFVICWLGQKEMDDSSEIENQRELKREAADKEANGDGEGKGQGARNSKKENN